MNPLLVWGRAEFIGDWTVEEALDFRKRVEELHEEEQWRLAEERAKKEPSDG